MQQIRVMVWEFSDIIVRSIEQGKGSYQTQQQLSLQDTLPLVHCPPDLEETQTQTTETETAVDVGATALQPNSNHKYWVIG